MHVLGIIPARLGSTRLPDKPLQLLAGEPLVARVAGRVRALGLVDELVVAADATPVVEAAARAGVRSVLTDPRHATGTERVAEVAALPEFRHADVVVNIQGDEPFLPAEALRGALARVAAGDPVGTAAAPLDPSLAAEPARVKVVFDAAGRALYFSRAPIPFARDPDAAPAYWQHLGLYACTPEALARWVALPPAPAEEAERLEQLRALHHGLVIGVARLAEPAAPGIDTPDDLRWANAHWHALHPQGRES